ncbi:MAG: SLC13 family permease [Paludibacteraceae bacterium]
METKKIVSLLVSVVIGLIAWCIPTAWYGIPDLSIVEQRVIALFLLAASLWVTEAIPIWATSVLTIVLMLLTVSTNSFILFQQVPEGGQLGTLINSKSIMATFADPIIMLFLGGFVLAIAATKVGLDANLARTLLKPFGTKPKYVLLGFIAVTAAFSAFMSNTATAAMMLTILAPILRELPANGRGKVGMALAIPVAANIGGMGTPIGTPPNAIALKFLNEPDGLNQASDSVNGLW